MRYVMRQKLFSWGDDFTIKDDAGNDVFFVDGKAFSIGDKLSFQDMQGSELAFIRQRLLAWGPTYEVYRGGALAATVKKQLFTFFTCRFTVDVPGPDDLEAAGDFLDHEYEFRRGGRAVAAVSKRWFTLTPPQQNSWVTFRGSASPVRRSAAGNRANPSFVGFLLAALILSAGLARAGRRSPVRGKKPQEGVWGNLRRRFPQVSTHKFCGRTTLTDTYGVDIAAGEDDVLVLAATVVIDMVCHADRKR